MTEKSRGFEESEEGDASASGSEHAPPHAGEAARLVAIGVSAAQRGNWPQAATWLRQALRFDGAHVEALDYLAVALQQLGEPQESIAHLRHALALKPERASLWRNLANAFAQQGEWAQAQAHFQRAAVLAPADATIRLGLGMVSAAQGRLDDAVGYFQQALSLKEDLLEAHNKLANIFSAQGKLTRAVAHYRRALAIRPDYAQIRINLGLALAQLGRLSDAAREASLAAQLRDAPAFPHFSLGMLLSACGLKDAARIHFGLYLERDPADSQGAHMLLAQLGFEQVPERAPDALIDAVYARRAASWGEDTAAARAYRGADIVAQALRTLAPENEPLAILDAGCGTGLVGSLVAERAQQLDGVDFSAAMIAVARQRGVYHALHQGELVEFLRAHPQAYDAITCAATLIHFGDLRPVLEAAAAALRDRGLMIFTVFPSANANRVEVHPDLVLAHGGCFAHGRDYIARTAEAASFKVKLLETKVHERNRGKPRMGLVVGLRRRRRK